MAVVIATEVMRRTLLLSGSAAVAALLGLRLPAAAQSTAAEERPLDPGQFLNFAYSSAALQERASALAAAKDTRPEVKDFAREMVQFREQQLSRLRAILQERGMRLPVNEEFEHRVMLENLEPLDYLALSRRYAEVQVQALGQEIRGYEAAERAADDGLRRLAGEMLPQFRQRLEAARRMHDAVKP